MSEMVHITINKQPLEVPAGTRIIEAAKMLNIDIPHLCYHPDQTIKAHCRMCMVEVVFQGAVSAAFHPRSGNSPPLPFPEGSGRTHGGRANVCGRRHKKSRRPP